MTDLKSTIQRLNLLPQNKAAAEVLAKMGEHHDPNRLAILELVEAKANKEDLVFQNRDSHNIYIPKGTSGADLRFDLTDITEGLTPEMAEQITEEWPETDGTAEEMVDSVINSLTREQWAALGLRTVEYPE